MSAPDPLPRFIANGPHGRAVVEPKNKVQVIYHMGVAMTHKTGEFEGWGVSINGGDPEVFEDVEAAIWRARVLAGTVEMR